ncbi:FHA domain-containing protein [Pseudorhodoferax sp.]|uniref:FHA domain-containing protein n=1 Tax=Pseudorhodoferax sp. TaxID=1993553 RepID=UPI002DD655FC|nr:FHA domain-containing protein [Pseudorhodoferax sp.]
MPKLIVSIDGVVIKEVQLTKERTTLGRRPYNDVVIDNLAVSGEHAAVLMAGNDVQLEDLNSTNGTYVNSRPIRKQLLRHNDMVEIGKYKIKFLHELQDAVEVRAAPAPAPAAPPSGTPTPQRRAFDTVLGADLEMTIGPASIRVTSGSAAGREVALVKVVTTIGKPGVAVAAITRRPHGYVVVHVEGVHAPQLNGIPVGTTPVELKHGDVLQLAGTQMEFLHAG